MEPALPSYEVTHVDEVPDDWPQRMDFWQKASPGSIGCYHPRGSGHRPGVTFGLLWSDTDLHLRFDVADQYLLCASTRRQDKVYQDSCVEFFVKPAECGHVNFEVSANGTMLASHIRNPARTPAGFVDYSMLTDEQMDQVEIHSSVQGIIVPERHGPVNWWIALRIPIALLRIAGGDTPRAGTTWRANFYKCSDLCAMPHYGSWSPVGEKLDFHQPSRFGQLRFVRR